MNKESLWLGAIVLMTLAFIINVCFAHRIAKGLDVLQQTTMTIQDDNAALTCATLNKLNTPEYFECLYN